MSMLLTKAIAAYSNGSSDAGELLARGDHE